MQGIGNFFILLLLQLFQVFCYYFLGVLRGILKRGLHCQGFFIIRDTGSLGIQHLHQACRLLKGFIISIRHCLFERKFQKTIIVQILNKYLSYVCYGFVNVFLHPQLHQ